MFKYFIIPKNPDDLLKVQKNPTLLRYVTKFESIHSPSTSILHARLGFVMNLVLTWSESPKKVIGSFTPSRRPNDNLGILFTVGRSFFSKIVTLTFNKTKILS